VSKTGDGRRLQGRAGEVAPRDCQAGMPCVEACPEDAIRLAALDG
jgi:NAD-dependent dihydropyrimidine dehydrogenase PreA subunit